MDKKVKESLKSNRNDRLLYCVPPLLGILLWCTYQIAPEFYLEWILQPYQRESQLVEAVTFFGAFTAGLLLLYSSLLTWHRDQPFLLQKGVWLLFTVALAALFFAGEEISWGQSFFGWDTPESYQAMSLETNLHNTGLPIQSLGSLFIIGVFFILPLIGYFKPNFFPENLSNSLPPKPAIFCIFFGFVWKFIKEAYQFAYASEYLLRDAFYVEFVEQINEQKEMFFALGLLMYGAIIYLQLRKGQGGCVPLSTGE